MTAFLGRIRHFYGAHPLHLLALIAAFALAGYAVRAVVAAGQWQGFALWFAVAIVGHDLLLFPLYSLADLSVRRLLPRRAAAAGPAGAEPGLPPVLNHIRIPAALSALLLLVWFPLILGLSAGAYRRASGLGSSPYLWRWLAVSGALFTISAISYSFRVRRERARVRRAAAAARHRAIPPGGRPASGSAG